MKEFKEYLLESNSKRKYSKYVNSVEDLYKIAREIGDYKKYPYAIDAIAYYIFGNKEKTNLVSQILRGEYGHNEENKLEDETEISSLMIDYENNWGEGENIKDIDKAIRNMKLKCGEKVEDIF